MARRPEKPPKKAFRGTFAARRSRQLDQVLARSVEEWLRPAGTEEAEQGIDDDQPVSSPDVPGS